MRCLPWTPCCSTTKPAPSKLDAADPGHRELFHVPPATGGRYPDVAYFAGNSLGLQPKATRRELLEDLDDWARLGVEGHLEARPPVAAVPRAADRARPPGWSARCPARPW